jgi:hypothetical protein
MPNWCSNWVTFQNDDPKLIQKLAERFSQKEGEPFNFLRPQPEVLPQPKKTFIKSVGLDGEERDIDVSLPDWYAWRVENWGTKWEAAYPEIIEQSEKELKVNFDTAWGPPIALYEFLHENGWGIDAEYREENMGFEGRFVDGIDETWDIVETDEEDAA